jgi:3-oxoacyl-[acyl-carrier protein] reductase
VTTSAYSIHSPKDYLHGYSAMKHAVANFTKNIAKTYGPSGIRANTVCPGTVKSVVLTAGADRVAAEPGTSGPELERIMLERYRMPVALGRFGETHELGDTTAFLLSGRAAYTSRALITVDGGTDF